ncbi:hypothetical protein ACFP3I_22770 [Chryseobacterium arachidis]
MDNVSSLLFLNFGLKYPQFYMRNVILNGAKRNEESQLNILNP